MNSVALVVLSLLAAALAAALLRRRREAPAGEVDTLRLEKERALASETLFRRIFNTALDGVAVLDRGLRITEWNPQAAAIFGWPREEAVGKELVPLIVDERAREELQRLLTGRSRPGDTPLYSRRTELGGLRRNGEEFPLEIAVAPFCAAGTLAYSVFLRDITERKRIDLLQHEFVSTVSHELRTPLTSIRGSLRLIAGGFTGALESKTRTMVDVANESCERLVMLVNDILDIEKVESGKMTFDLRIHDLSMVVKRAVAAGQPYAEPYGVQIRMDAPEAPCRAVADRDRLMQVLTNFLSNAVKYSPKGGTVRVSVLPRPGRVRVEVEDRGPGIPAEFRSRIFQKFAQADAGDGRVRPGTGLGLNICKAIVDRLGGTIGFESEVGAGSTFWFELPAGAPEPVESEAVMSNA